MNAYACPSCGSDNTQSFASIYDSGRYSGGSTSYGTAYVDGKAVPVGGYTSHSGMTDLARSKAPPEEKRAGVFRWILLFFAVFIALSLGGRLMMISDVKIIGQIGAAVLLLSFYLAIPVVVLLYRKQRNKVRLYNDLVARPNIERWRRSVHCFRCNHDFLLR